MPDQCSKANGEPKSPIFRRQSTKLKSMFAGTALAASLGALAVHAQTFPPFPEPAVGPFPDTQNMKLLSQLLPAEINAVTPRSGVLLNDIWGWTSPEGEEYALVGTGDGMSIIRVSDPKNPEFIGQVPTTQPASVANLWGDVAVYNVRDGDDDDDGDGDDFTGYAYFTTEADGVGISILELNKLDDMAAAPVPDFQIPADAVFAEDGYDSAHNIYINQKSGFAYVAGVGLTSGPTACDNEPFHPSRFNTMILDLNEDPLDPEVVACLADFGEHDIYVVNYRGPDRDYRGREIAFVFDGREKDSPFRGGQRKDDTPGEIVGGTTEIWDVTDKDDIKVIASFTVPGICFSHQGWTSSNRHEFLLINDELDELRDAEPPGGFFRTFFCGSDAPPNPNVNPSLYVMNIRDLDNPVFQERFEVVSPGDNDHNFIREGNKLYWAVYNAGTRVLKMKKKKGMLKLEEIARLDSEPRMAPVFNGQWGIFPFSESETIVASDIVNGLMVMRLRDDDDDDDEDDDDDDWGSSSRASSAAPAAAAATARGAATLRSGKSEAARRADMIEYMKSRIIY